MMAERIVTFDETNLTVVEKEVYNELVPPDRYGRVVGYGLGASARMVHGAKNYAGVTKDANMEQLVQAHVEEIINREREKMESQFQEKFKQERSNMEIHMKVMELNHQAQMSAMQAQMNNITSLLAGINGGTSSWVSNML